MSMMSNEEFYDMSRKLEIHHGVFYKMFEMSRPCFVEDTPTAYVRFDKEGDFIKFAVNEKFWRECNSVTQQFVICHESLHVILNHGIRAKERMNRITNQALDIVVNHLIVKKFGIKREDINNWQEYCWVDTMFPDDKTVPTDENFEYYYNRLLQQENGWGDSKDSGGNGKGQGQGQSTGGKLVDDHEKSFGEGNNHQEVIEKLNEELSPEEKNSLRDMIESNFEQNDNDVQARGTTAGGLWKFMDDVKQLPKKRKWETVIKKWSAKYLFHSTKDKEQWARLNRRFAFMQDSGFFIPSEMEVEEVDEEKRRIKVHFFLDTSGSCMGLADRFWKAANSLPEDRFDVRLYCFDTEVYKVDMVKRQLYGFGGTSFSIIENYIQQHLNDDDNEGRYPEAVFMITDGYGDNVRPQFPERWHVFLTNNCRNCFPTTCKFFKLEDYE